MEGLPAVVLAASAAFAATNLDGLLLAAALFADSRYRARDVVLGTFAGIAALCACAAALSLVSLVLPQRYIALLGLVPLVLGVRQLLERPDGDERPKVAHGWLAVAAINIAMGGDNIGVYAPLFASSPPAALPAYAAVFAALTAAMCLAAWRLVAHPAWGAAVRRHGRRAMPWILVALGLWILAGFF